MNSYRSVSFFQRHTIFLLSSRTFVDLTQFACIKRYGIMQVILPPQHHPPCLPAIASCYGDTKDLSRIHRTSYNKTDLVSQRPKSAVLSTERMQWGKETNVFVLQEMRRNKNPSGPENMSVMGAIHYGEPRRNLHYHSISVD